MESGVTVIYPTTKQTMERITTNVVRTGARNKQRLARGKESSIEKNKVKEPDKRNKLI